MTQNIIDQHICEFTVDVMQRLGLKGNCQHKARNNIVYNLIKNPFSTCPIKLLPNDILLDLPLADTFDEWLIKTADINSDLRDSINKHLGYNFFEGTKKRKKEALLDLLKTDKAFFIEVLEALKNYDFTHYDIEADYQGLHRWLKDSEKFVTYKPSNKVGFLNDDLGEIFLVVEEIIDHFKYSIEQEELWRIFWTTHYSKLTHVKEFYSQMLFYMVASSWVNSKDNNLNLIRSFDKKTKMIEFKFSVSGKYCVNVQVKHSDNYNGLQKSYEKKLKNGVNRRREHDYYLVINFDENNSKQLQAIQDSECEGYKIIEINAVNQENCKNDICDYEPLNLEFENMFTEFEKTPNKYSEGAHKVHEKTDIIKNNIIKPLFNNKFLIKGKNIQERADNICSKLQDAFNDKTGPSRLANFAREYNLDYEILNESREYFEESKSETIYKWCRQFSNLQK